MHTPYRGRSHTKKQNNNCKQKITTEERKKRKQLKQFAKLFPQWQHFLPCCPLSPVSGGSISIPRKTSKRGGFNSLITIHHSPL